MPTGTGPVLVGLAPRQRPDSSSAAAFRNALYDRGADVVLTAHEHNYEPFAPQNKAAQRDNVTASENSSAPEARIMGVYRDHFGDEGDP